MDNTIRDEMVSSAKRGVKQQMFETKQSGDLSGRQQDERKNDREFHYG